MQLITSFLMITMHCTSGVKDVTNPLIASPLSFLVSLGVCASEGSSKGDVFMHACQNRLIIPPHGCSLLLPGLYFMGPGRSRSSSKSSTQSLSSSLSVIDEVMDSAESCPHWLIIVATGSGRVDINMSSHERWVPSADGVALPPEDLPSKTVLPAWFAMLGRKGAEEVESLWKADQFSHINRHIRTDTTCMSGGLCTSGCPGE